jgi:hypothetical protein
MRFAIDIYLELLGIDEFIDCFEAFDEGSHEESRQIVVDGCVKEIVVAGHDGDVFFLILIEAVLR